MLNLMNWLEMRIYNCKNIDLTTLRRDLNDLACLSTYILHFLCHFFAFPFAFPFRFSAQCRFFLTE
jgi:hypothetical protein